MRRPVFRTRYLLLIAALSALTAFAGMAFAAQPKTGDYSWGYTPKGAPGPVDSVYFTVVGNPPKVSEFTFSTYACGGSGATVQKSLKVKSNGKFGFSGVGKSFGGDSVQMSVTGKFTSKTKARGTVKSPDCAGVDVKIDFVAKKSPGG